MSRPRAFESRMCKQCGSPFNARLDSTKKFCGEKCRKEYASENPSIRDGGMSSVETENYLRMCDHLAFELPWKRLQLKEEQREKDRQALLRFSNECLKQRAANQESHSSSRH